MPSPGTLIELAYARQLALNYETNKLTQVLKPDETRAVWFSAKTVLAALGLPDVEPTADITGLRFYFGAYGSVTGYPANPADYDKMTLVMIATGEDTLDIPGDVAYTDIIDPVDVAAKPQPAYPSTPPGPTGATAVYNDGQNFPPPSNVAGLGLMDWK